jgi:hypothetical protein
VTRGKKKTEIRHEGTRMFRNVVATEAGKVDGNMPSAPNQKTQEASTSAVLANEARRNYARVCHEGM